MIIHKYTIYESFQYIFYDSPLLQPGSTYARWYKNEGIKFDPTSVRNGTGWESSGKFMLALTWKKRVAVGIRPIGY